MGSMRHNFLALFLILIIYNSSAVAYPTLSPQEILNKPTPAASKRLIKILSIDGGGVRGIIPATILANLESRLPPGRRLGECFDIIAGTSAGGIIALLLATPDSNGKPKYTASFIANESHVLAKLAFSRSLWQIMKSFGGWFNAKYDEALFRKKLDFYFQDTRLKQVITNVIVPTYEIEQDKTFFFKANRAKLELSRDCYLRDLAYATTAAPTYFRPARLVNGMGDTLTLVDGGVSANNPTMAAAVYAVELYGTDIELFIVSIGTGTKYGAQNKKITYGSLENSGKLGWADCIIPLLMHASDAIVDYEMYYVLNFNKPQYYFRIQTILEPENAALDNISDDNLKVLQGSANDLIKKYNQDLDYIARVLSDDKYILRPEEKRFSFN